MFFTFGMVTVGILFLWVHSDWIPSIALQRNLGYRINDIKIVEQDIYGKLEGSVLKYDENKLLIKKRSLLRQKLMTPFLHRAYLKSTEEYVKRCAKNDAMKNSFNNIFLDDEYKNIYNEEFKRNLKQSAVDKAIVDAVLGNSDETLLNDPIVGLAYSEAFVEELAKKSNRESIKQEAYRLLLSDADNCQSNEEDFVKSMPKGDFKRLFG